MSIMLTLEQKAEMKAVVEEIWDLLPPYGIWQKFTPYLEPNIKNFYEVYWQGSS